MRIALTDLAIRQLKPPEQGQARYWDTHTPAFGIVVGKRTKTFVVMQGKDRRLQTIGRYPEISLTDARTEAKRYLATPRLQKRTTGLVGLMEAFLDDCQLRLRPTSVARYRDVLKHAPNVSLDRATRDLARTAHEIKAYKALFNFGIKADLCDRNPFQHLTAKYNSRDRVLTDNELIKIWHYHHPPFSDIIKLLILTGQRRNQIWKLKPEWIKNDSIHFPAEIMKQGRSHTIPLTGMMNDYLAVPFSFNGWSKAKVRMDKHTGVTDYTIHDLRRTYATIHARLGTPIHIVEALLAHTSGQISGVTAVYIRHQWMKEMQEASQRYENWLSSLLSEGLLSPDLTKGMGE